jgi:cytochrome c
MGKNVFWLMMLCGGILLARLSVVGQTPGASRELAQNGRGIKRPAERACESLSSLAARSRALCALGQAVFATRCTGCHALDHEKVGPRLGGVVGRMAGSVSTFPYSDAVKKSGVVWTEMVLDKWIRDPEAVIPDNDMPFRLNNAEERAAIIAFLKETGK